MDIFFIVQCLSEEINDIRFIVKIKVNDEVYRSVRSRFEIILFYNYVYNDVRLFFK